MLVCLIITQKPPLTDLPQILNGELVKLTGMSLAWIEHEKVEFYGKTLVSRQSWVLKVGIIYS